MFSVTVITCILQEAETARLHGRLHVQHRSSAFPDDVTPGDEKNKHLLSDARHALDRSRDHETKATEKYRQVRGLEDCQRSLFFVNLKTFFQIPEPAQQLLQVGYVTSAQPHPEVPTADPVPSADVRALMASAGASALAGDDSIVSLLERMHAHERRVNEALRDSPAAGAQQTRASAVEPLVVPTVDYVKKLMTSSPVSSDVKAASDAGIVDRFRLFDDSGSRATLTSTNSAEDEAGRERGAVGADRVRVGARQTDVPARRVSAVTCQRETDVKPTCRTHAPAVRRRCQPSRHCAA